ncbi:MAG: hypothetical protein IT337_06545 [Thermomicrobiales bacterium]|nr:hypothetical protein [Thermomicrobiales bacterium]
MLPMRTLQMALFAVAGAGMVTVGLARTGPGESVLANHMSPAAITDEKIATAMSAAPSSVSAKATILDSVMDAAGKPIVLRQGSNGWTCMPDFAATPRPDPMCLDQVWMGWAEARMTHTTPNKTAPGLAYMLQGGSDASNTDPFATEPAAGDDWVNSGPHIMVLLPDPLDQTVFSTDPNSGGPWIMWPGTPYEHIMMPVGDLTNAG